MGDPVRELVRDHGDIDHRTLAISSFIRKLERAGASKIPSSLLAMLDELREGLFRHFAREEEGLFPFVLDTVPELAGHVREMELAHDEICGELARVFELARAKTPLASIAPLFRRFENAYAEHARLEASALQTVDGRLDAEQRARLAELVRGL